VKAGPGYAKRWRVEWTFAWLGNYRRLLVRYERHLSTFRAFFVIAFVLVLLRHLLNRLTLCRRFEGRSWNRLGCW
jgi:hypothetical protein